MSVKRLISSYCITCNSFVLLKTCNLVHTVVLAAELTLSNGASLWNEWLDKDIY